MSSLPLPGPFAPATRPDDFPLGIDGFRYSDLWDEGRLRDLAEAFQESVKQADSTLHGRWQRYAESVRAGHPALGPVEESELLIRMAAHLSRFVAKAFGVEKEAADLEKRVKDGTPIFRMKTDFMARRTFKKGAAPKVKADDFPALDSAAGAFMRAAFPELPGGTSAEGSVARAVVALMDAEKALNRKKKGLPPETEIPDALLATVLAAARADTTLAGQITTDEPEASALRAALDLLERWSFARSLHPDGKKQIRDWVSYRLPKALDYSALVETERPERELPELAEGPAAHRRRRDGFKLTDRRASPLEVEAEVDYCLLCHEREKDSCSTGFEEPAGSNTYRKNPLGIPLAGCPLDERIGEAHALKAEGDSIGALAIIALDNPMAPGTGHRICNDCMKACVFQKQEPVNIPQAETGILTDVLALPWGVEIYGLLARWNPLDARRPSPRPYSGKNVLVVGMGPAGYTLAHYLLNEGFGVVGIDGLKIEPLPDDIVGAGGRVPRPIRLFSEITSELDDRILSGFGGVSEYGITVRWDKNFLTLLQLTLSRRRHMKIYGGVRFGGTLTLEDAWSLGFDHVAIATGAGRPTIISMKNNLIRGIRKASDFLMALQLTGAYKRTSMANLQVRLPAVVIGGGLTAIDTATELLAYYPVQVEQVLARFETLAKEQGESAVRARFGDPAEAAILEELLEHGRAVRAERDRARLLGEEPDFQKLVRAWGGVHIAYRKTMTDSPAYRLNHEEVVKAFEEGVRFVEKMSPVEAVPDEQGAVSALVFERQAVKDGKWRSTGEKVTLPARTVCVAAGTSPNVTYEKEYPGTFELDEWKEFFRPYVADVADDGAVSLSPAPKSDGPKRAAGFFTSYRSEKFPDRYVTYFGDNHPVYAGNVVKAMASAKDGYPHIVKLFAKTLASVDPKKAAERETAWEKLEKTLDDALLARVVEVRRLTPTIVEIVVRAKWAAQKFQPGQFYRLQNYEHLAPSVDGTRLTTEGIALTGAWVDKDEGLLSLIVLEMGGSSRLVATLEPGTPVVAMGPTGAPTEIPKDENVMLVGGGLGNAVLFSIAKALKANGCKVLYFAGYKKAEDLFKRDEIEAGTDQVIWSTDPGSPTIEPRRPQDKSFTGNIVQAMTAYASGELGGPPSTRLDSVSRMIVIGSDRMMAAVKQARKGPLAPWLKKDCEAIGSINSPMQCMMKEICAQCLQKHVDPETGKETVVFSCFNQDQRLDEVDFQNLNDRLRANGVLEKLTNLWLDRLLQRGIQTGAVKLYAV